MTSLTEEIKRFITDDIGWDGPADELADDLLLIQEGVLDSLGVYLLVTFLESNYAIVIEDGEIVPANLGSIASIERFVRERKLQVGLQPSTNS